MLPNLPPSTRSPMIRCLTVDDEAYASVILAEYIHKVPFLALVGSTTSAIEALTWVQQGRADLIFLDIQMPELTGLQFLKLCGSRCKVVLTTAYPQYALDGFEHDVVDYLLKPIAFERFLKAAQKAYAVLQPALAGAAPLDTMAAPPVVVPPPSAAWSLSGPATPTAYMFIKGETKNKYLRVEYANILYIEGLKNYVSVYTPGQRLVTYQTLRDLEGQLPQPPFVRVHKSYIVSLDKIRLVDGNTVYIQDRQIPVGDTYREPFYRLIREQ